jgi:phosphatidylserine/phosphatidylglycerophosphate/cardiolipin synthase-like enzyme
VNDNNHAKVYVIDGETLLITGMNIANSYRYEWHDYLVELRGNYFVERFLTEGELPARDGRVRLALNTPLVKEVRPELEKILKRAKRSILLEQSYFSDSRIIDILVDKSKEGVRVTVIVPATVPAFHSHANKAGIATLLSHGNRENIQVFRYPEFIHAKLTLIDRKIAFVGSANFYADSLDSMGEANVYIEGSYRVAVRKVRRILRKDILVSELVKEPPKLWLFEKFLAWLKL